MTKNNIKKALVEVEEILKYIPLDKVNKIPTTFIEYIEKNKNKEYKYEFDSTIEIEKQITLKETKMILGMLYLKYWSSDDEKKKIYKRLEENEIKYQEYMRNNYNEKFVIKKQDNEKIEKKINGLPVKYKESFINKFMNFLKNLFKKGEAK